MLRPSFLAHGLNGILMGIGAIAGGLWLYNDPMELGSKWITALTIVFILVLAILIGIHGISHALQEVYFGWNPLTKKDNIVYIIARS